MRRRFSWLWKHYPVRSFGIRYCKSPVVFDNTGGLDLFRITVRLGALPQAGPDHALGLSVDQRLVHVLRSHQDTVINSGRLQGLHQIPQGKLVHGHRASCSLVSS